jgi:hypothetical protein
MRSSAGRSRKLRFGVETVNLENKEETSLITVPSMTSLRSLNRTEGGGFGSAARYFDIIVARMRNAVDEFVLRALWRRVGEC